MTSKVFNKAKFEAGKEIHFLLSQLDKSINKKQLPLEIQQSLSTIEARYWTLHHALQSIPQSNKLWSKHPEAYELVFNKTKIRGRKNSSINLSERVRDYYFLDYLRNKYELTLDSAITNYLNMAKIGDADGCKFERIKSNYNYIQPKIQYFLNHIK